MTAVFDVILKNALDYGDVVVASFSGAVQEPWLIFSITSFTRLFGVMDLLFNSGAMKSSGLNSS